MAKFDAGTAVEAMEYDFTAYGGEKGIIPEPTTGQINAFFNGIKDIFRETKAVRELLNDDMSEEETEAILVEKLGDEATLETLNDALTGKLTGILADLCSDRPSRDQIEALPFRVQMAFQQWVAVELRPNQETPGTQGSSGAGGRSTTSRGKNSRTR